MAEITDTLVEKIFAGEKERAKPTFSLDGFDPENVTYSEVQQLPSGIFTVRREVKDFHAEIGQRRVDIISYNPKTSTIAFISFNKNPSI